MKLFHLCCQCPAGAYAGTKLLVGDFETCCDIDGVAISRVVEEASPAEITDYRRPGVNADTGYSKGDVLCRASALGMPVSIRPEPAHT